MDYWLPPFYFKDAEDVAQKEGFSNYEDMSAFFEVEHGALPFNGVLIGWKLNE